MSLSHSYDRLYGPVTDVDYELVSEAAPETLASSAGLGVAQGVRLGGAQLGSVDPSALAGVIAALVSGSIEGREAGTLAFALRAAGLVRDPATMNAIVQQHGAGINAYIQQIDMPRLVQRVVQSARAENPGVLACALDPGAALPLLGLGAVVGGLAVSLIRSHSDASHDR